MDGSSAQTRRQVLKGSVIIGVAATAGCTVDTDDGPEAGDTPGSVSMEPVGSVTFEEPPDSWIANNGSWADMGVALGEGPPGAVYLASRYHTQLYDEIPGVSVDKSGMESLWGSGTLDKEDFLAWSEQAELFAMDPNFIANRSEALSESDTEDIEAAGATFFGNSIFSRGYEWHDYDYLDLYEAFEKLSVVFHAEDRYEAFEQLHGEFQSALADLETPQRSVAMVWPFPGDEPEEFLPYLVDEGTSYKQWRDIGVADAFDNTDVRDFHEDRSRLDYETLLSIDPEVILMRGNEHKTAEQFQNTTVAYMENHDVASKLTAVQNGDVYRGGPLYQGPIINLVLTERAVEQLYGIDEALFDRERVADIVNGNS